MSEISEDGQEEDDIEEDDDVQTVIDDEDFEADMGDAINSESLLEAYSTLPRAHAPVAADPTPYKPQNTSIYVERQKSQQIDYDTGRILPKDDV